MLQLQSLHILQVFPVEFRHSSLTVKKTSEPEDFSKNPVISLTEIGTAFSI